MNSTPHARPHRRAQLTIDHDIEMRADLFTAVVYVGDVSSGAGIWREPWGYLSAAQALSQAARHARRAYWGADRPREPRTPSRSDRRI